MSFLSVGGIVIVGLVDFLVESRRFLWGIHILGVVFGLGGATVTDVMFVNFMRDFRIQRREAEIMETLSKVVWVGIALLILSGLGLLLPAWDTFWASDRFVMKMTAVAVVLVNGIFLNLWIQPRARRISFVKPEEPLPSEQKEKQVRLRRIAFALGGISFVSWYSAYALAVLDMVELDYLYLLAIFIVLLVVAVAGSQFHEHHYREQVVEELHEEPLV